MSEETKDPASGTPPRVSVIVPVYNMAPSLADAIHSLREQTLRDIEVILVNDGSTDASLAICEQAAADDPRFRVLSGPNGGLSAALNRGLAVARGEWIGFCDADDCAHPALYGTLLDLAERERAELPCVALRVVSAEGTTADVLDFPIVGDAETIRGRSNVLARAFYPLLAGTRQVKGYRVVCLFRRDIVEARRIRFCPCMCEDEIFILEYLLAVEAIAVMRKSLYDYVRLRPSVCERFFSDPSDYRREHSWYLQSCARERIFATSDLAAKSPNLLGWLRFRRFYHEAQDIACDRSLPHGAKIARFLGLRARVRADDHEPCGLAAHVFRGCLLWLSPFLPLLLWAKRCRDKMERRLAHAAR